MYIPLYIIQLLKIIFENFRCCGIEAQLFIFYGNYTGAKEGGGTMTLENKHLPDHAHITIILTDLRRTSMKELILSLAVVISVLSIYHSIYNAGFSLCGLHHQMFLTVKFEKLGNYILQVRSYCLCPYRRSQKHY